MQTLCHTLIYFDNFHQFEYVWIGQDICQDRSGFYPPKSQPDLPRLAQALQTNISLADLWLRGMAIGAASSGRTVQWPWLNLLPSPIRSCSSTSVGNWLLNIYEPWVHDHFMTSQGIACPIHTMSLSAAAYPAVTKCSSNRWDMVGGEVNWLCRSIILHDPWIHRWLHRQGHTVGYRSDAAWTASRLPCLKKSLRWISCGTVTYSYCDLQTIAYTHTKSRQCKTMRINAVHVGDSMSDSVSVRWILEVQSSDEFR